MLVNTVLSWRAGREAASHVVNLSKDPDALVEVGTVSTWVAFIIIAREIAIMGLRSVAALDSSTVPPSMWGKSKAALQFTAIALAILRLDIVIGPWRLDQWFMAAAVVVTVVSAGDYFSRFRSVFTTSRAKD